MIVSKTTPLKALNKSFLKEKVTRASIELFKANLLKLFGKINESESEEHLKNCVTEFLKDTWYKDIHEINTKGRSDLVIHTGSSTKDSVGVILEVKKPSNKSEMISAIKPNTKALQELVLYYLRERNEHGNIDIKFLIATNIFEWYIIDEVWFEKFIFRSSKLQKDYNNWKLSGNDTKFFYENIAKPHLETITDPLPFTYFDLKDYKTIVENSNTEDDKKLIALYKILSPVHILKQPFANDSNSLDTKFYNELLHLIGLEDKKDGAKRLIKRKTKPDPASFLENAIMKLEDKDCLRSLPNLASYGKNKAEQLLNVALELSITWINRILFIKLLEAQLAKYHRGDKNFLFLNNTVIFDFDELNNLFFLVLAERRSNRRSHLKEKYNNVPYLNSSLFERTELERQTIDISSLDNRLELLLHPQTVLKDLKGKRRSGGQTLLSYLFDFLNAYDFTSEGAEEIQEENKNLINASVLGLIFEKINGYKDGSFFTPGFITMYMCKETLRLAVLNKFNDVKGWKLKSFGKLYDKIEDKVEANQIINSLKICDPAVGSGHFLVSALNELISIKSELKILLDTDNKTLRDYHVEVVNDELIITDEEGRLLEYNFKSKESQRIQEAIFHEKETIIENCLFGVDINPNSVKICRLRLWIELLKHAYYTKTSDFSELETLPNIDINIKTGNSLISRFEVEDDLKSAFKGSKYKIKDYRDSVSKYKTTNSREEKYKLLEIIDEIKGDFKSTIDEKLKGRLARHRGAVINLETNINSKKEWGEEVSADLIEKLKKAKDKFKKHEEIRDKILTNAIYRNAFEWRFEFPEIMDAAGNYLGFDAVIGNPPYGVSIKGDLREAIVAEYGNVPDYEIYYYFMELSKTILNPKNGLMSLIIPNTILFNMYAKQYRVGLFDNWCMHEILDCTNIEVFSDATVRNVIVIFERATETSKLGYRKTGGIEHFEDLISGEVSEINKDVLLINNQNWGLAFKLDAKTLQLTSKIRKHETKLIDYFPELSQGLIAYDKYQGQDEATIKNRIYHSFEKKKGFKPWLYGEDVTRYNIKWNEKEYINYCEGIANPREPKFFNGKRILVREITNPRIFATITNEELYNDPAILIVKENEKGSITLNALLGILNSKLATFYHFNSSPKATKGAFPKILVEDLRVFPIPEVNETTEKYYSEIDKLVSKLLSDTKNVTIDKKIDTAVMELYDLSKEDVELISNSVI